MQIYHYTSIETLALILSSGRLRFNRIDNMDDLREHEGLPDFFAKNLFLSCWTADPAENIVLWGMYTANRGIRIEFPRTFYNNYYEESSKIPPQYKSALISPLPHSESYHEKYIFSAMSVDEHGFWTEVEYCSDAKEKKKSMWHRTEDGMMGTDHHRNLVRYKDDQWAYQKEFRFFLYGHPREAGYELPLFVDVPINPDVLNNIIVRLHPNAETPSKLLVGALLDKYTTGGKIEESTLNGIVRPKTI